jgi:hypothetical protein
MDWVEMTNTRRLMGGTALLPAALLSGLLFVAIYKPERIRFPTLFRLSYVFLAMAIIVPPVLEIFIPLILGVGTNAFQNLRFRPQGVVISFPAAIEPVFLGISVISAFGAIAPPATRSHQSKAPLQRHPLD